MGMTIGSETDFEQSIDGSMFEVLTLDSDKGGRSGVVERNRNGSEGRRLSSLLGYEGEKDWAGSDILTSLGLAAMVGKISA
jgi:hypothetical protein